MEEKCHCKATGACEREIRCLLNRHERIARAYEGGRAGVLDFRRWKLRCGKKLTIMAKEFFGTDGIRGVPGTSPLDDQTLYAVGRSVGSYLLREHGSAHVLIGMDTRESGPHIAGLLAAGLYK